jgi:hypothetical protein
VLLVECFRFGRIPHLCTQTAATVDTAHSVQKEDEKSPQGNELKAPFGELIVSGRQLVAAGTNCPRSSARTHVDFDALVIGTETGVLINESRKVVATVQNRDELQHEGETGNGGALSVADREGTGRFAFLRQ